VKKMMRGTALIFFISFPSPHPGILVRIDGEMRIKIPSKFFLNVNRSSGGVGLKTQWNYLIEYECENVIKIKQSLLLVQFLLKCGNFWSH
jgi:hypothetical protein